jgi:D-3-phosphoglycerate dehydrogenase / 2-oxoglutarate reductase
MSQTTTVGSGKQVLVGPVRYGALCAAGHRLLVNAGFDLIENASERPYEFPDLVPHLPHIDAVIGGVEVWDEKAIALAPRLRIIARLGVGLDNIDLEAAAARGIAVTNVPGGNANAVAELVVGLLISLQRKITTMNNDIRDGRWDRYVGSEVTGKTLGLVGFGAIAQLVAKRLRGFDLKVLAHDPFANTETASFLDVELAPLAEVLGRADIVSVHAPDTPKTHHLISAEALSLMPSHAVLINTSRGGLVDEAALYEALVGGRLAGAALDVWENEPVSPDNPLLRLPNVVATTHAAADTEEAYHTVGVTTANAVIDVFRGRSPKNLRNRPFRADALIHP